MSRSSAARSRIAQEHDVVARAAARAADRRGARLRRDRADAHRDRRVGDRAQRVPLRRRRPRRVRRRRRRTPPQVLIDRASPTTGRASRDLDEVLAGRYRSATGMGLGIVGARRLMDDFDGRVDGRGHDRHARRSSCRRRAGCSRRRDLARLAADARWPSGRPGRSTRCSSRTRSCCATLDDAARAPGGAGARQPRARGHQPRRRRALRRARRARRSPAARRRDEDAVPVEHDPRVPDAGELDSGADEPARRAAGRRPGREGRAVLHPQVGAAAVRAGRRPARPRQGRGRQDRGAAGDVRGRRRCSARCAACCGRCSSTSRWRSCSRNPTACRRCYSDESKVSQILRNFISNALKYTERGEVRVSARLDADARRGRVHGRRHRASASREQDLGADLRRVRADREPAAAPREGHRASACRCRSGWPNCSAGASGWSATLGVGSTFSLTVPLVYRDPLQVDAGADRGRSAARSRADRRGHRRRPAARSRALAGTRFQLLPPRSPPRPTRSSRRCRSRRSCSTSGCRANESWDLLARLKRDPADAEPSR